MRKFFVIMFLCSVWLPAATLRLNDNGSLTTVDVTGWIKGEDYVSLNNMYCYPWNGETTINFDVESGLGDLKVEGKMRGLMLFNEYTMAEPDDTADIITVNVTSGYLDQLYKFPNLAAVTVMFMNEKADFTNTLGKLKNLRALDFNQCSVVDDESLSQVKNLKELRLLKLIYTTVTDEGLKTVGQFIHLRELWLTGTQITDAGLAYLKGLSNLRVLWVNQTQLTPEGVAILQKALPDCLIMYR